MGIILKIYFRPRVAIYRLVDSNNRIVEDDFIEPYLQKISMLKGDDTIRHAAHFFELWAEIQEEGTGNIVKRAVNSKLLQEFETSLDKLSFTVVAANHKRTIGTGDTIKDFSAQMVVWGDDYEKKELIALTSQDQGREPAGVLSNTISLGYFQIIRPTSSNTYGVDQSIICVCFRPSKYSAYESPSLITESLQVSNSKHEEFKLKNRIFNKEVSRLKPNNSFVEYNNSNSYGNFTYLDIEKNRLCNIEGDIGDVKIEANLFLAEKSFTSAIRTFSYLPDFDLDYSNSFLIENNLLSSDIEYETFDVDKLDVTEKEIADLLKRAYEIANILKQASILNYQSTINEGSQEEINEFNAGSPGRRKLKNEDILDVYYLSISDITYFLEFLKRNVASGGNTKSFDLKQLFLPPQASFEEEKEGLETTSNKNFHRQRTLRNRAQKVRIPPYLRDSDATSFSLTRWQYNELISIIKYFEDQSKKIHIEEFVGWSDKRS